MSMPVAVPSAAAVAPPRERARGRWSETWFHLLALAGAGAIVAGSYMTWATFYAGLIERNGVAGHGKYFIGLAVAGALAAALSSIRGAAPLRWLVPAASLAVAFYAARDLRNLYALQHDPAAALFVPGRGDGLYVVLAGAALLFAAFLVAPRLPLREAVSRWNLVLGLGAVLSAAMLVPGLYGVYYLHFASGGHQTGHTSVVSTAYVLIAGGVVLALPTHWAFILRLGRARR